MKTVDLGKDDVKLDRLLHPAEGEPVHITSKTGDEFVLEAADAFEREIKELESSAAFREFLSQRSAESGRISLNQV